MSTTTILGREIGTSTGWDEQDTFVIILYGFQPNADGTSLGLLSGDMVVDWDNGYLIWHDGDGHIIKMVEMVDLHKLPRKDP